MTEATQPVASEERDRPVTERALRPAPSPGTTSSLCKCALGLRYHAPVLFSAGPSTGAGGWGHRVGSSPAVWVR